jgi:hypothetical protein
MRTADAVVAGLLLLLAAGVGSEGIRLGFGWGPDGPRPGFFVFYLAIVLAVASLVVLGQAVRASDPRLHRRPFLTRERARPVATVLLPAVALVGLTHWVGLYVAGAVYLAAYMRRVGRHSWALTAALAVGIPVATFLVFETWFLVPLPKGPLETYLGY